MPENKMAVVTRRFAECDEIAFFQLQFGMEMEWMTVMYLKLDLAAANRTDRKFFKMLFANCRPMRRTRSTERMLALGSIDKMANDGHKKARSWRA